MGTITMKMPCVYVAQLKNLEQWYNIRGEQKQLKIVETIDKGLGPRVQKLSLQCRHVMEVD